MEILVSDFITAFDKFKDVPSHEIEFKLGMASSFCDRGAWKERWKYGVMLVAAHFLERDWQQSAATAAMASAIAAGAPWSPPSGSDDDFKLTSYGAQYLQMRSVVPSFGLVF